MNIEKLSENFVKDLIPLINSLGSIPKTATVKYGATNFSYIPLDDILSKIKENNNFAFMQPLGSDESGHSYVQCVLIHKTGETLVSDKFPLSFKDSQKPQEIGSVITYMKRYSVASFLGIASDEDNDGQTMDIASPKEKCEACGNFITGASGLSPEKIIEGSMRTYGKKMCFDCCVKAKKSKTKTVEKEVEKKEGEE